MKKILLLLLPLSLLFAVSHRFTELRYSDATGDIQRLEGKVTFGIDALKINYKESNRTLSYLDGNLTLFENAKPIAIPSRQKQGMIRYLELILLLNENDETSLDDSFEVTHADHNLSLHPKGSAKRFIESIEVHKEHNEPRKIRLNMTNRDYILIDIHEKIR